MGRSMLKSSSVSGEIYTQERTDGSQSDTALGTVGSGSKKRRSSLSARVVAIVGNRRSRSTSQISGPGESAVSGIGWNFMGLYLKPVCHSVILDHVSFLEADMTIFRKDGGDT